MAQNQRKKNNNKKSRDGGGMKSLAFILVVVVGLAGAVAIGTTAGGGGSTTNNTSVTVPGGVQPAEFQKVSVTGDTLPKLPDGAVDPAAGKKAPALSGFDLRGRPMSITPGADGKATLVVFLAHWCPHCNAELPVLKEWRASGKVPANMRVIGVTTGSQKGQPNWPPSKWLEVNDWPFDILADSEEQDAARAYGVGGYPFMAFVDPSGNVVRRTSGEIGLDVIAETANLAAGVKA
jgi:thiol-disulfide isomerase/thioredoxin